MTSFLSQKATLKKQIGVVKTIISALLGVCALSVFTLLILLFNEARFFSLVALAVFFICQFFIRRLVKYQDRLTNDLDKTPPD